MKIPRDLSGRDLISALCRHWNYRQIGQEGSHVLLVTDERSVPGAHGALRDLQLCPAPRGFARAGSRLRVLWEVDPFSLENLAGHRTDIVFFGVAGGLLSRSDPHG